MKRDLFQDSTIVIILVCLVVSAIAHDAMYFMWFLNGLTVCRWFMTRQEKRKSEAA